MRAYSFPRTTNFTARLSGYWNTRVLWKQCKNGPYMLCVCVQWAEFHQSLTMTYERRKMFCKRSNARAAQTHISMRDIALCACVRVPPPNPQHATFCGQNCADENFHNCSALCWRDDEHRRHRAVQRFLCIVLCRIKDIKCCFAKCMLEIIQTTYSHIQLIN